ncbi:MAG: cytidine deaminase [Lachnospiraceae bacterium]|nr:cytidine deaminase [Lachnospiraceae bacterium]
MEQTTKEILFDKAKEARKNAYTPYSHYQVGAALLCADGRIFTGCNIENAGHTPACCAERTAFFKAVSEGVKNFKAIAVVAGPEGGALVWTAPCGVCRQVMMEFCEYETFEIYLGTGAEDCRCYTLKELLPHGFGPGNLDF